MFCVKFNSKSKARLRDKFAVVFEVMKILPVKEKVELYWSDYTFAVVPETKSFDFIQSTLVGNSAIIDDENAEKFITIILTLEDEKKIRVELTPPKARVNYDYMPHIEFSFADENQCLYTYFRSKKKLNQLQKALDRYKKDIDEAYFYDPLSGLDCYSDIKHRVWQKRNNQATFAKALLSQLENDKTDLEVDTHYNLAYNFSDILFRENGIQKIAQLINTNNLHAAVAGGSLILSGEDVPILVDLLQKKLEAYIKSFLQKNPYEKEFENVFKA